MAKEEIVKVDEEKTVDEVLPPTTPYPGEPVADEDTPGTDETFPPFRGYEPTPEQLAENRRAGALQMASYPGNHEAKEPIASVLARAEAYRLYIETGETGIVA